MEWYGIQNIAVAATMADMCTAASRHCHAGRINVAFLTCSGLLWPQKLERKLVLDGNLLAFHSRQATYVTYCNDHDLDLAVTDCIACVFSQP